MKQVFPFSRHYLVSHWTNTNLSERTDTWLAGHNSSCRVLPGPGHHGPECSLVLIADKQDTLSKLQVSRQTKLFDPLIRYEIECRQLASNVQRTLADKWIERFTPQSLM
jgi:hypothetical protein